MSKLAFAVAMGCVPASVGADSDPAAYDPGLATLDRQTKSSTVIGEATYVYLEPLPGQDSLTPIRIDAYGSYVDSESRFGGYAQLPVAIAFASNGGSDGALGDLELGVIYSARLCRPTLGLVLHAGLTAPTGTIGSDPFENALNESTARARITDFDLTVPRGISLRQGVSAIWHASPWFARGDVGLDVNLYKSLQSFAPTRLRLNVAGGVDLGTATIAIEIANSYPVGQPGNFTDVWMVTGAVSARFRLGEVEPFIAAVFPLDQEAHDSPFGKFETGVTAGFAARR